MNRLACLLLAASLAAVAGSNRSSAAEPMPLEKKQGGANAAREYFPDTILTDQRGDAQRFHSDLLAGKVVVIGAVATDCKDHCKRTLETWRDAQEALGKRMEARVRFLTLASDPARDTADHMAELAKASHAVPGWYFLSGTPKSIRLVLAKLDLASEGGEHARKWVIANIASGLYKVAPDSLTADQLVDTIRECLEDE